MAVPPVTTPPVIPVEPVDNVGGNGPAGGSKPAPKGVTSKEDAKPKKSDWYENLHAAIDQAEKGTFKIKDAGGNTTTLPALGKLAEGFPKIHCRFIKAKDFDPSVATLTKKQRQATHYLTGTIKHDDKYYIRFPVYWEIELDANTILSSDPDKTRILRAKMVDEAGNPRNNPNVTIYEIDSFKDLKNETFVQTTVEQPRLPEQKPGESTYINGADEDLNARRMALQVAKQYGNSLRFALGHGVDSTGTRDAFISWFTRNNFVDIGLRDRKGNDIGWTNIGPDAAAFGPTRKYHEISKMFVKIKDGTTELEYELPHLKTALKIQAKVGKAQFSDYLGNEPKVQKSEFNKLPPNLQARYRYQHFLDLLKKDFDDARLQNKAEENRHAAILLEQLDSYERERGASLVEPKYTNLSRAIGGRPGNPVAQPDDAIFDAINVATLCAAPPPREQFASAATKQQAIATYRTALKAKIEANKQDVERVKDTLTNALQNYDVIFTGDPTQHLEPEKFVNFMTSDELDGLKEYIGAIMNDVYAEWHFHRCAMEGIDNIPAHLNHDFDRQVAPDYAESLIPRIGTGRMISRMFFDGLDETKVPVQPSVPPPVPSWMGSNVAQGMIYTIVTGVGSKIAKALPGKGRAWVASKFTPEAEAVKRAFSGGAGNRHAGGENAGVFPPPIQSQEQQRLNFYDAYKRMIDLQSQMFQLITIVNVVQNTYEPGKSIKLTSREFFNSVPLAERDYQFHKMNLFNKEVEGIIQSKKADLEAREKIELVDRKTLDFMIKDATASKKVEPPAGGGGAGGAGAGGKPPAPVVEELI